MYYSSFFYYFLIALRCNKLSLQTSASQIVHSVVLQLTDHRSHCRSFSLASHIKTTAFNEENI